MSGIILYKSKYGSTKKYAGWLANETGFELVETDKADIHRVCQYDTIILGGGVYASGIAGISFLKKNWGATQGQEGDGLRLWRIAIRRACIRHRR